MKTNYLISIIVMLFNYAQAQNLEWVKSVGGVTLERAYAVAVDSQGSVYTVGTFNNTVDFDPSAGVYNLTSNGNEDIFIQKLDATGNFVWAKSFGGSKEEEVHAIVIDTIGNIYIAGAFQDTVDFDPNANIYSLISNGYYDAFIQKLDANGDFVWAKAVGSGSADIVKSIAVDGLGNVYAAGSFYGTVDFDPSIATYSLSSSGGGDGFVQKLDANGNFVWAHAIGGNGFDGANALALDNNNNVYTVGFFNNTVDFDPNVNTSYSLTSNGYQDVFVQKLDSDGNFIWAKTVGGSRIDYPYAVAVDAASNVYTVGFFHRSVDFDPDTSVHNLTSRGSRDAFIQKLDGNGNFVWAHAVGGGNWDYAKSVAVDRAGNVYTVGNFTGQVDLDPSTNVYNVSTIGSEDVFIQKLASDGTFMWGGAIRGTSNEEAYAVVVDDLDNIYTVGIFYNSPDFDPSTNTYTLTSNGDEDVFVQKISQGCNTIVTAVDSIVACDSYTWIDGNTYTSSNNTATYMLTNALGCDSVVTLNLTINASSTGVDSIVACASYTWIDGMTYTMSNNTATYTLTNALGCDSVVTLDLTITTVDTTVTLTGNVLTSNAIGATYQWLDCNAGNTAITGATAQNFTPSANGDYAVVVTQNTCVDTSSCKSVTVISLKDVEKVQKEAHIYPNPTTGQVLVVTQETAEWSVSIVTTSGQEVYRKENVTNAQHQIDLSSLASGIYWMKIQNIQGVQVLKVIKK